ncbi:glutathione binding-like protein [Burkholderiaceae bacterium FT117]|uniref:glutathione binding-like protein n=1 Tax=Zeimonas sediminis TaxID=2944268 RepID=UPI0023431108|nr:glutathione binding-like protein [Zeimonas sediminis]MCM5569460.1 glutathione binding-like protein [Zeimonas sediminis]
MIELRFWPSPDGYKPLLFLEECGLEYRLLPGDAGDAEPIEIDYSDDALADRVPAMIDHSPADGGEPLPVFEPGEALVYLAEKTGRFLPADLRGRHETLQWLFWQTGGLGPVTGHGAHFAQQAFENRRYAIERYLDETQRLYGVLDRRLADRRFVAGDDYTIADMASHPWVRHSQRQGQHLADFRNLARWFGAIERRPAARRAYERGRAMLAESATARG